MGRTVAWHPQHLIQLPLVVGRLCQMEMSPVGWVKCAAQKRQPLRAERRGSNHSHSGGKEQNSLSLEPMHSPHRPFGLCLLDECINSTMRCNLTHIAKKPHILKNNFQTFQTNVRIRGDRLRSTKKPSEFRLFNASIESQLVSISLPRNPPTSALWNGVVCRPRLKV